MVPGVPPFSNYSHFGTEVLIDGLGTSGSIIINPSYVEKKIIQKVKSSVIAHLPTTYKNGLDNVKFATEDLANKNPLEYKSKKILISHKSTDSIDMVTNRLSTGRSFTKSDRMLSGLRGLDLEDL